MLRQTPDLTTWLRDFAADRRHEDAVDQFVRYVNDGIREQLPVIASDPLLNQDLDRGTGAQWRAFLDMVADEEYRHDLPSTVGDLARSLARRGMDLGVLLKVYRLAHQRVFGYLSAVTEEVSGDAPGRDEILVHAWGRAGQWIDDTIELLIDTYYEERRRLHDGAAVRRAALVEGVLEGTTPVTEHLSGELSHALHQWQTAFVVWAVEPPDAGGSHDKVLRAAAAEVGRALGAPPPLLHAAGTRGSWGWVATPSRPDLSRLSALAAGFEHRGVHLTVGVPAPGVDGFRRGHEEARAAHRIAGSAARAPVVLLYQEVELLCLAEGNRELLERMVRREIGPLCGTKKNLAQVRQTVLAYLTRRDLDAVAADLFVHKNTVRYRLSKAEELLGHALTERSSAMEIALRHVALFGPPRTSD